MFVNKYLPYYDMIFPRSLSSVFPKLIKTNFLCCFVCSRLFSMVDVSKTFVEFAGDYIHVTQWCLINIQN